MCKQRIMPLVLAAALCSTGISASHEPHWIVKGLVLAGIAVGGYFGLKYVGNRLQARLDRAIGPIALAHEEESRLSSDAHKLTIMHYGIRFTSDQLEEAGISQKSRDLINQMRTKR